MKKHLLFIAITIVAGFLFTACRKEADTKDLWKAVITPAAPVSDTSCLMGTVKGTMLAGKTYTVCDNLIVNVGDTLTLQEGVTVKFMGNYGLGVKGTLISLGTKDKPNWFTYYHNNKTDQPGVDPSKDSAYAGKWTGIIGDTSCKLMILKWTHIEFGGGAVSGTIKPLSKSPYPVFFQNPLGIFVMEDSWIYGSVDDPFRILGGKIAVLRNTFEKSGYQGGEAMNAKAGTIGDFAYNLCIGMATNGPKLSNSGVATGVPGSNVRMYNNTIVNCGYRRLAAGRGGSINFEEGAAGMAYNNIIVNCKFGLRVVQNPIADTANLRYGYNLYYGDSLTYISQFIPSGIVSTAISAPQATDIPNPFTYLPAGWKLGDPYTAPASLVGANNPQFINAPVPLPAGYKLADVVVTGNYNFRLKQTSPCVGAGYTGFKPRGDVPIDPKYGVTELTPPGKDLGAYQISGVGNQH
ncbi:MAG TPA: hypothetical protein VLD19_01900 [Chitinophagaceae bacterium]|nr:hypothetical protein [Chitinophagaceae bacterium]